MIAPLSTAAPLRTVPLGTRPVVVGRPAAPSAPIDSFQPASAPRAKAQKSNGPLDVPFITQLHVPNGYAHVACGPTSLAMVMTYQGRPPKSVLDVCQKAGTNPKTGTSNRQLEHAAQGYHFKPVVGHSWAEMEKQLAEGHPVVVKVNTTALSNKPYPYDGPHCIVVTGLQRDAKGQVTSVICNDPGTSHPKRGQGIHYSVQDFTKAWGRYGDWSLALH